MASNAELADQARQRGNTLYKANKIKDAIKAYHEAAVLAPSDSTPLSNLSAATFEAGDYQKCVQFGSQALTLLDGETDLDPRKQKLLVRLTKAKIHLSRHEGVEALLARLAAGPETETLRDASRRVATAFSGSTSEESTRNVLLKLPRYKPHLTAEADYFAVGHDIPESQYGTTLATTTRNAKAVSFLFCGIGDARNLFKTMAMYAVMGPECNPPQRLHFTILDHKPAVLARNLIFFVLLDDLSQMASTTEQDFKVRETIHVLFYLFSTQIIPGFAWERLQKTIQRLLVSFEKHEQPISWAYIPAAVQEAVCHTLKSWQPVPTGPYATARIRQLTSIQNMTTGMQTTSIYGKEHEHFPEMDFEHSVFDDFSIVLPDVPILEVHDPELTRMVRGGYVKGDKATIKRMSEHINSNWRSNITLVDMKWESEKWQTGERHSPDLGFTPFMVIDALAKAWEDIPKPTDIEDSLTLHASVFFDLTVNAVSSLRGRMMVEVCLGEMADVLERTTHHALDHRASKDSSVSIEWPDKYSVVHMSNIPDYVGGPLTSFLFGCPVLERGRGTGLVSCVLRNPPRWNSIDQFLSEYLQMYDRKLVQSHFHLKLSSDTPERKFVEHGFALLPYYLWERTAPQQMSFEQLMPKKKLLHWLHAHFLKLCLPYPRQKMDYTLVYAPLNLTLFMRLIAHVANLGYPAHWLSGLLNSILEGEITSTARAPRRVALLKKDVDELHPPSKLCTKPWSLEVAALVSLWQGVLPFGIIAPSRLIPQAKDVTEYTVAFSEMMPNDNPHVPHFMLVFYDGMTFGKPPKELRSLLLGDGAGSGSADVKARRENGVRVLTTFQWTTKDKSATFWLDQTAFEKMVEENWRLHVWRTDTWEMQSEALELQKAAVKRRSWEEWALPGSAS